MSQAQKIVKAILEDDLATAEQEFQKGMRAIKRECLENEKRIVASTLFEDTEIASGTKFKAEQDGMGFITLYMAKNPRKNVYFQGDDAEDFEDALQAWERRNGSTKFDKFIMDHGFDSLLEGKYVVSEAYEVGDNVLVSVTNDPFLKELMKGSNPADYRSFVNGELLEISKDNGTAKIKLPDGTISAVDLTSLKGYNPTTPKTGAESLKDVTESKKMTKEETAEFNYAAAKAKKEGKDQFKLNGKTYNVTIGDDEAEQVLKEYSPMKKKRK